MPRLAGPWIRQWSLWGIRMETWKADREAAATAGTVFGAIWYQEFF